MQRGRQQNDSLAARFEPAEAEEMAALLGLATANFYSEHARYPPRASTRACADGHGK